MDRLESILDSIPAEHLGASLLASGVARVVSGEEGMTVEMVFPYPAASAMERARAQVEQAAAQAGLEPVAFECRSAIEPRTFQGGVERVEGVKNIVAVASAKGGVGKSTVAVNLALALQAEGARTGLLDADIYGPSVPTLLGGARPQVDEQERIVPLQIHGLRALSMGHLVDPDQAMIWRGPMVVKALRQLLRETAWGELDFLVLDMPPGTGDIQLSVAQSVPVAGAVLVTTAQDLALADAVRGLKMFERVSIPALGYVANMTSFICPGCGQVHELFGAGAGERLAREHGLALLAELPLDPRLGAAGEPALVAEPGGEMAGKFRELAARTGAALLEKGVDRGAAFPKIVSG